MRIAVIGLRGFPGVQGGIETHAENLYPLLAQRGHEVTVFARAAYLPGARVQKFRNVSLVKVWSPKKSGLEAMLHSLICTFKVRRYVPDVVHVHGIGPGLVTPLLKLMRQNVVVTHHGRDYEREKWGRFARWTLRIGEKLSARFADVVVCVAKNDANRLQARYPKADIRFIPNGVSKVGVSEPNSAVLNELGLSPGQYVLNVARMVPEKRQDDLIQAFLGARKPDGWKLVLVGAAMDSSDYFAGLREKLAEHPDCVLAGFRKGDELANLYRHAAMFVLPSSHEGLSITLLEALGFGLPCIASDIAANHEVDLPATCYFPVGDTAALAKRIQTAVAADSPMMDALAIKSLLARFDWGRVANETNDLMLEFQAELLGVQTI